MAPVETDQPTFRYLLKRFLELNQNAAKVYLPVHLIILIMRIKKNGFKNKKNYIRFIKEMIGSCLFASSFAMSIPSCYTSLCTNIPGLKGTYNGMIVSFLFSWAIFFDDPSRWSEMSLYVLAQWFEGYTYSLYKRQYLPPVKYWRVNYLITSEFIVRFGNGSSLLCLLL